MRFEVESDSEGGAAEAAEEAAAEEEREMLDAASRLRPSESVRVLNSEGEDEDGGGSE